jgi:hypothetical protein
MPGSDNSITILPSPDVLAEPAATDFIGGAHHQRIIIEWGPNDTATRVDDTLANRLPVAITRRIAQVTGTILNGATVSDPVDCRGLDLIGIEIPATITGTQFTFQVSIDGSVYQALYDIDNNAITMTVTASRTYVAFAEIMGWNYLKIVAVTTQAADAAFKFQLRG